MPVEFGLEVFWARFWGNPLCPSPGPGALPALAVGSSSGHLARFPSIIKVFPSLQRSRLF
ncbi:MAG: hypothetical protein A2600_10580 [Candidatus Lambdaproteobacteria bacterium RIFOXYD1_FULL_56_27]|uniref:Uncharacterized protein n=1 Tax=Candidatus Lambdaproteobacteria bacterium RIFOXYD2_FULL_56_26 TaxID=1817773 RepID=A0A1F6GZ51_9PROT|nr:MAG: hypothetical protein A2426_01025 [Candidatus Lambdaproteobacteria bacterium RIFOXYC1_FULL_56_13]OGH03437.1 MAG: hypothetical protein A2557_01640 [Candidatus Lambdaproteobacteria bacterium RIFOXYD2_FULL_56_26]OGH08222.1 MAG: hypothetical protein A2600_10580 [Candidatus Lambdaproteobacteria bacterium RIFOXYD1_FULL_56_27]